MTLTIGNVEQWRADLLTTAAGHANSVSVRLDQLTGTASTDTRALNWSGAAGTAANTRMDAERTRCGAVSAALLKLDTALRAEVTNLIDAKDRVLRMRDTAVNTAQPPLPAFQVADDGTVSADARIAYLRRSAGEGADSADLQRTELGQRLVAASHQWHIVNALASAQAAADRATTQVQQAVTELENAYNTLGDPGAEVPVAAVPASTVPGPTGEPAPASTGGSPAATESPGSAAPTSSLMGGGSPAATADVPTTMPTGDQKEWIQEAIRVLRENGYDIDDSEAAIIALMIERESGGDPNAINLWDSNAAAGIPSKGLMQTIDPTFNAHALPGHGDIWNPVDNIIAGTRYAIDRYGSLSNVPGVVGVANGTGYVGY